MASYLVTGGAGFIGSHLVEELLRRGHTVRVADNLVTGKRENLSAAGDGATTPLRQGFGKQQAGTLDVLIGDVAEFEFARRAVDGVDYVLHQAAIPSVPRSVTDPMTTNRANVDATVSILVAARDANVKRVVFAGSSS